MNGLVDIIIADITAGQINWCFAKIEPRKQNPLYGIQVTALLGDLELQFNLVKYIEHCDF